MKSNFGVITFTSDQLKSEEIVLSEPNFLKLENQLRETKKKIELGRKVIAGLVVTTVTVIVAGIVGPKLKPIPVKTTKRF